MQATEISPELADAADVLSKQLLVQLKRMATLLVPHLDRVERRFLRRLQRRKIEPKQRAALAAVTPGAAARIFASGRSPLKFIEQVEYNGRRLAKFNLPPAAVLSALKDYERLLTPVLKASIPGEYTKFEWVREQLHFSIILTLNNAYYQVREKETQAFYELFRLELESRNLDELVQSFLATLVKVCRAEVGHLYLLDEAGKTWVRTAVAPVNGSRECPPAEVSSTPAWMRYLARPRYIDESGDHAALLDPSWAQRFPSCWSVPLATKGRTAGVMQFGFSKTYEWLPREQELLAAAAERCLLAAEKARLMEDLAAREEQVRRLAEHMLHVEEVERRRISRELHDEAGQSLLCIRLQMELLEQSLPETEGDWRAKLREARDLTERTILEMRRLIAALSPAVLEQLGLGAALRQLVNRFRRLHPCRVRLHLARIANLPQSTEIIVYRLVQECCNNIAKHSSASHVNISVASADEILKLNVEDNGVGFAVEEALARRDSFGLSGMRERVALLGGRFEIRSSQAGGKQAGGKKDRGTKISIELPIPREGKR